MSVLTAFLSLLVELGLGYPDRLVRAIGHPVIWIGNFISFLDRKLNRAAASDSFRRFSGCIALFVLVALPAGLAYGIETLFLMAPLGIVATAILGSSLLAQRSLANHVKAVADALEKDGLSAGRTAVSQIVGRDPDRLDEAGVSRAAIESLAENFSDGIVAPVGGGGVDVPVADGQRVRNHFGAVVALERPGAEAERRNRRAIGVHTVHWSSPIGSFQPIIRDNGCTMAIWPRQRAPHVS